jgi:hypothetical protein
MNCSSADETSYTSGSESLREPRLRRPRMAGPSGGGRRAGRTLASSVTAGALPRGPALLCDGQAFVGGAAVVAQRPVGDRDGAGWCRSWLCWAL